MAMLKYWFLLDHQLKFAFDVHRFCATGIRNDLVIFIKNAFADPEKPKPWSYQQPTWIFTSRSLKTIPGADIRFVKGDVRPVYEQMREAAGGKNIWIVGGGHLAAQFHERGLLDEMIITIAPVILAAGAPLFTASIVKPPLRVVSVKPYPEGFVQMHLQVQKNTGT